LGDDRIRSVFLLPLGLISIALLFYLLVLAGSFSLESLRESGFVFTPIAEDSISDAAKLVP